MRNRVLELLCYYCCSTGILPFNWNSEQRSLTPGSRLCLSIFGFHRIVTFCYTGYVLFRLAQVYLNGEFSLLSGLWAVANIFTSAATENVYRHRGEVMYLTNQLLKNRHFHDHHCLAPAHKMVQNVPAMAVIFALVHVMPIVHAVIIYQNPCAVNFISSQVLPCTSSADRDVPFWSWLPFIVFEIYQNVKWELTSSFLTCVIVLELCKSLTGLRILGAAM